MTTINNPVTWFEIYVEDMNRAATFYQTVLATKLEVLSTPTEANEGLSMMAFPMNMNGAGASGALCKMKGCVSGNNSTVVYFESEDCAIEEARIEAAGGKIHKSKMSIGQYGFIVLALDTEGNMFGLHSVK